MTVAFGSILLLYALIGLILAYLAYDDFKKGRALLYVLGAAIAGFLGYLQALRPLDPQVAPIVGVAIFVLAAYHVVMGFRELTWRDKPLREEKLKSVGLNALGVGLVIAGICQFAYVV